MKSTIQQLISTLEREGKKHGFFHRVRVLRPDGTHATLVVVGVLDKDNDRGLPPGLYLELE